MKILDIQFFIILIPISGFLIALYMVNRKRKPKQKGFISKAERETARAYLKNQTPKQRK